MLYAIASGGTYNGNLNNSIRLMGSLGTTDDYPETVFINELTTVDSTWTMAQLMNEGNIILPGHGEAIQSAIKDVRNFVDLSTRV